MDPNTGQEVCNALVFVRARITHLDPTCMHAFPVSSRIIHSRQNADCEFSGTS